MRGRLLTVIVAGFLIGALSGAALLVVTNSGPAPMVETTGKALIGGPFTLVDQAGKTVTDQDFRGRYMLVFFGFTHCPDICPAELQVMSAALDELGPKADQVVPIFITLDPERDTQAAMAAYVKNFRSALRRPYRFTRSNCCSRQGLSRCLLKISARQVEQRLQYRPLGACLFNGQGRRIHYAFRLRHACRENDRDSCAATFSRAADPPH